MACRRAPPRPRPPAHLVHGHHLDLLLPLLQPRRSTPLLELPRLLPELSCGSARSRPCPWPAAQPNCGGPSAPVQKTQRRKPGTGPGCSSITLQGGRAPTSRSKLGAPRSPALRITPGSTGRSTRTSGTPPSAPAPQDSNQAVGDCCCLAVCLAKAKVAEGPSMGQASSRPRRSLKRRFGHPRRVRLISEDGPLPCLVARPDPRAPPSRRETLGSLLFT